MICVISEWPDGAFALIFGMLCDEVRGLRGSALIEEVKTRPGGALRPVVFVLTEAVPPGGEEESQRQDQLRSFIQDTFPQAENIAQIDLTGASLLQLRDGGRDRLDPDTVLGTPRPPGWNKLVFIELRSAWTEEALVASLEGRQIVELGGAG